MIHKITKFRLSDGKAMLASALQSVRNFDRRSRLIMTLAALLAVTTGAWAQGPTVWTGEVNMSELNEGDILAEGFSLKGDVYDEIKFETDRHKKNRALRNEPDRISRIGISSIDENCVISAESDTYAPVDEYGDDGNAWVVTLVDKSPNYTDICLSGIYYDPNGVALTSNNEKRTVWTIDKMPAADVELTVRYYDDAEVKGDAIAAEGVHIGEDKALVSGLSTEHGTLVYAITAATVTTAPADDQFAADKNTAKGLTTEGTYRVWYYVDPDATHSPSVPAYVDVKVLTNKFDITFTAANANTIESGKATVSVKDGDADPVDMTDQIANGVLADVTMGQTVILTAAEGYKFIDVKEIGDDAWLSYEYTGNNTFFGRSAGGRMTWDILYTPSMLTGNILTTVKSASYTANNPVTLKIYSGGDAPESGELLATQVFENTQEKQYYEIELEQPVEFDPTKNLWIELSQESQYAAYCGKRPTDANGKIWYRLEGSETWYSNEDYTPVIYPLVISAIPATLSDDGKTASLDMPANDVALSYDLRRDLSTETAVTVSIGGEQATTDTRLRIAKDGNGAYKPVKNLTCSFADNITGVNITDPTKILPAGLNPQFYLQGDNDTWTLVTDISAETHLPTNIAPGQTYQMTLAALDASIYTGETPRTISITLYEGYEVSVPAQEYITYFKDEALTLGADETEAKLYTITAVDGQTATATEVTVAKANMPILVKNTSTQTRNILLIPTTDNADDVTVYEGFVGTLTATNIAASDAAKNRYAFNGKQFVWVKNALAVGANKAWLEIPAGNNARVLTIVFGETTGISTTDFTDYTDGVFYDLNGRKLQTIPTKKGVYIQNGKKVVVK